MKLFGYWRSSATYRVRIALALKGVEYEYVPINLLKGEHKSGDYLAKNPMGLVPSMETDCGEIVTQSIAIMEYLEESNPNPTILPDNAIDRARARAMAQTLACEAQPLMNLRIQNFLKNDMEASPEAMAAWLNQWPGGAMRSVERQVDKFGGDYCVGHTPTVADCCLVPQMYGALRFGIDVGDMPRLREIYERCCALPAFALAHPDNQIDAVKG
ncbi:MAG: maleylacetoacetate isomerase [Marinicaulis sp.]|nr:maleylacetoacetate isomerase [Marinicaulis sp.]